MTNIILRAPNYLSISIYLSLYIYVYIYIYIEYNVPQNFTDFCWALSGAVDPQQNAFVSQD